MNRLLVPYLAFSAAIFSLAGCDPEVQQQHSAPPRHGGGFTGDHRHTGPIDEPIDEPTTTEPRDTERTVRHEEPENTAPKEPAHNAPAPVTGNYEYGKGVPGKPGFVTSPYAPYQGYVDVRGYAPGTEVKDPYTGKTFLVPAQ
jgi:hypothetical protein